MNILRSLRTSVLGLVFAVVAGAACSGSSDVPPLNADCSINTDCNNPLVCAFKRCHNKCTSSRDCPEGQRCVKPTDVDTGAMNANVCQLPEETRCHLNSECPDSLICGVDGLCRNQCDKDRDCLGGQICSSHTCADLVDLNDAGMLMQVIDGGITRDGIPLGSDAATLMHEGGSDQPDSGSAKDDANGQGGSAGNAGNGGGAGTVETGGSAGTVETGGSAGTGGAGTGGAGVAGSANVDSGADVSVGNDGAVDAGSDVSVNSCASQPNGTPCGTDLVCRNFTCVSCASGGTCPNGGSISSCKAWKYTCATGFQVCQQSTDNAPDFSSCGNSYYCSAGQCLYCSAGGACTPANECHKGTVVCSPDAGSVCNDTQQNATDDTPCQGNKVCAAGVCVAASRTLTVNAGGGQTALIDALLTLPVQIKLADGTGTPVAGKTITLTGAPGSGARPSTAVTDVQGMVSFSPRVGFAVGTYEFTATGEGASALKFSVDATAPAAGTVFTVWNTDHAAANDGYPGPATLAHANGPIGFARASDGSIYLEDYSGGRIFKMSPEGAMSLFAGTGGSGSTGDGGPAISAQIGRPWGLALDEASSSLYMSDYQNSVVRKIDLTTGLISTYAGGGVAPQPGYGDSGFRTAAVLASPTDVSLGPDGALYISDSGHNRIRRVAPNGVIDAWLNVGDCNDTAALAGCYIYGEGCAVTWDKSGAAFVAGQICGTSPGGTTYGVIRKPATGPITHVTGHVASGASTGDGVPATLAAYANTPRVAFDDAGNLFVAGYTEHKIRRIDGVDTRIKTIAGDGTATYAGDYVAAASSKFNGPTGMLMLPGGHLLIADYGNHAARVIWGVGTSTPSVVALSITAGTNNQSVRIDDVAAPLSVKLVDGAAVPKGIAQALVQWSVVDPGGALYAPTSTTNLSGIGSATIRPGLAVGAYHFQARVTDLHGQDVPGSPAQFTVNAIAPTTGDIFTVVDADHSPADDGLNGPGILAHIRNPDGVAVASDGTIYFVDRGTHRVSMLTPKGVLVPLGGNGSGGYSGDPGLGTSAQLSSPTYTALDEANGFLYVSDTSNNRIRVIELATGNISLYAGGTNAPGPGYGDSGPATSASLASPGQLAINPVDGALYVADNGHNKIRKIAPSGIITTFYNSTGVCTDAVDLYNCSNYWCGIAFDATGNAYMSGWTCGTVLTGSTGAIVKRAASNGAITLVGGHMSAGSSSVDGADATAYFLSDYSVGLPIAFGNGDLYVSMYEFHRIVRINLSTGKLNYIAGDGTGNYLGDYSPAATSSQVKNPQGIAWMTGGHLVFGDYGNSAVRMIW